MPTENTFGVPESHEAGEEFSLITFSEAQKAVRDAKSLTDEEVADGASVFNKNILIGGIECVISLTPTYDTRDLEFGISPIHPEDGNLIIAAQLSQDGTPIGKFQLIATSQELINAGKADDNGNILGALNLGSNPQALAKTTLTVQATILKNI